MQKRLLQDLERQWLDSWGQAGRAQAQVQASPADGEAAQADAVAPFVEKTGAAPVKAGSLHAMPVAMRAAPDMPVANEAHETYPAPAPAAALKGSGVASNGADRQDAMSGAVEPMRAAEAGASPASPALAALAGRDGLRQSGDASPREAGLAREAARAPAPKGALTSSKAVGDEAAAPQDATLGAAEAARTGLRRSGDASSREASLGHEASARTAVASTDGLRNLPESDMAERQEAVVGAAMGRGALMNVIVEPEASMAVAATSPTSAAVKLDAVSTQPARLASPTADARDGDAQAAKAPARRMPPTTSDSKPSPQHLMLREISEQEVLASLRDVQLGTQESQLAAQGLARALMQAGYARVQIVVNGQQQLQGASTDPDDRAQGSADRADTSETSTSQPVHHGNQY